MVAADRVKGRYVDPQGVKRRDARSRARSAGDSACQTPRPLAAVAAKGRPAFARHRKPVAAGSSLSFQPVVRKISIHPSGDRPTDLAAFADKTGTTEFRVSQSVRGIVTMNRDRITSWLSQSAPATIVSVLGFGILGSMLYDMLVKPGLSSIGQVLFTTITLGSTTLRDAIYSSAALDPTPVTALIFLWWIAGFLFGVLMVPLLRRSTGSNKFRKLTQSLENGDPEDLPEIKSRLSAMRRKLTILLYLFGVPAVLAMTTAVLLHNQAIIVWRVSKADLALLRPHVSPEVHHQMEAQFAGMKNYGDFEAFRAELEKHAKRLHVQLRPERS